MQKIDKKKEKEKPISIIKVRKIKFTNKHLKFWTQYDMTKEEVLKASKKYEITPISHFWLNTSRINNKMFVVNDLGFSYDYFYHKGILLRKIYLPSKRGSKFFTNCNTLITQGYNQLPLKGDLLFITSSLKDVIILNTIGFEAVAPSNENIFIPKYVFENLKKRFKKIILFYDNDFIKNQNWGKLFAQKHSKKYNIPYILLPDNTEKDPSDFSKHYGKAELLSIIKIRLNDIK